MSSMEWLIKRKKAINICRKIAQCVVLALMVGSLVAVHLGYTALIEGSAYLITVLLVALVALALVAMSIAIDWREKTMRE